MVGYRRWLVFFFGREGYDWWSYKTGKATMSIVHSLGILQMYIRIDCKAVIKFIHLMFNLVRFYLLILAHCIY